MGFLIFAYRKLFLRRRINNLNFRAMLLSQRKQKITNQIGQMQQTMSSAKNMVNIFTQNALAGIKTSSMKNFGTMKNGSWTPKAGVDMNTVMTSVRAKQEGILQMSNVANSIFESANSAELNQLNSIDNQISLEIANIDSQTKQLMPELANVEKAESEAAKAEAPKFGLG